MTIDLKQISFSELAAMVNAFPWFGAARKELAIRSGRGADAALYVCSRRLLNNGGTPYESAAAEISSVISKAPEQKVIVLGGDFFSQDQYDAVRKEDDDIFSSFADPDRTAGGKGREDDSDFMDLCTETLAKVYAEQGYTEQAKYIYSKLILRYPEKNTYFAALIEKLGQPED